VTKKDDTVKIRGGGGERGREGKRGGERKERE